MQTSLITQGGVSHDNDFSTHTVNHIHLHPSAITTEYDTWLKQAGSFTANSSSACKPSTSAATAGINIRTVAYFPLALYHCIQ